MFGNKKDISGASHQSDNVAGAGVVDNNNAHLNEDHHPVPHFDMDSSTKCFVNGGATAGTRNGDPVDDPEPPHPAPIHQEQVHLQFNSHQNMEQRHHDDNIDGDDNEEVRFNQVQLLTSVTRFGDLLNFGQLFKAFGNNYFAQISHILRQFLI